ncbi:hypothetical protein EO244_04455 [Ancylomarina salipaludis]|uniref:Transposase IS200-like domain-containing protein n=1 Tax=Ancylomarina salipaludis TaxID=2501299 RepID=A0A4Q1JNA7_9BACT|nr:transposase [Ancylomarina salipaludis]RXQ96101.1 hypothetical protein EO244_04455 [Ancylomarina salipaludis]
MQLSEIGKLAEIYWHEIPLRFPFAAIDEFVVMPDHIHGIIIINKQDDNGSCSDRDAINRVCTDVGGVTGVKNPMLSDNLSRIVRWYKGRVSFESRKIHADFMWHSRFYDHIIRNDEALQRIRNYVKNNPSKWAR